MANFEPDEYEPEIVEAEIVEAEIVEADIVEAKIANSQSQNLPGQYSPNKHAANQHPANQHPAYQQPEPKKSVSVLVVLSILAAFFLLIAIVIIVSVWLMISADNPLAQNGVRSETEQRFVNSLAPSAKKWDPVFDAFSEPESDVSDQRLKAIRNSLDEIISVSKTEDAEKMRKYVHKDGFLDQMVRSELCTLNYLDRLAIKATFDIVTDGPVGFEKYQISCVKQLDEDEVLIYMYLWGTDGGIREYCFWMRESRENQSRARWQVSDWESLRSGISEAAIFALLVEKQETPGIQNYYTALEINAEAFELIYDGKNDLAIADMERALQYQVHSRLQDSKDMSIGFGMATAYQWEKAIEIFDDATNAYATPGVKYGLSLAHFRLGNYAEAIKHADDYLRHIGRSPSAINIKANALHELGKNDEAIDQLKLLLKVTPDDEDSLDLLISWLPSSRVDELVEVIGNDSERAYSIARKTYLFSGDAIINTLAEIVENNGGSKAKSLELKALAARNIFEYPKAADFFLEAMKAETEPEALENIQTQYLNIMMAMDKTIEGFLASPLKAHSFEYLSEGGYDEYEVNTETLIRLVAEGRKQKVKSTWIDYIEASILLKQKKYQEAKPLLERGLKMARESEKLADESDLQEARAVTSSYEYSLRELMIKLEKPKQAILVGPDRLNAFSSVASTLSREEKFNDLKEILSEFKTWSAANPNENPSENDKGVGSADDWIRFYDAVVRYRDGDEEAATAVFDFSAREDLYSLQYRAQDMLRRWAIQDNKWKALLTGLGNSKPVSAEKSKQLNRLFASIFQRKLDDESYEAIGQLSQLHKNLKLETSIRKVWQMQTAHQQNDDKTFLQIAKSLSKEQFKNIPDYQRSNLANHCVDALLRMNKIPEALEKAKEFEKLGVDSLAGFNEFLCHVSTRDIKSCREFLESNKTDDYYFHSQLNARFSSKAYNTQPEFKDLRNEFPAPLFYQSTRANSLQLMLKEKPDFDEFENKILGLISDKPESLLAIDLDSKIQRQRVINLPDSQVLFSLTDRPLIGYEEDPGIDLPDHAYVFSVSQTQPRNTPTFTLEQALESLIDENCVAAYLPDQFAILNDPTEWLKNRKPNEKIKNKESSSVYLYVSESGSNEGKPIQYWETQKNQLAQLAKLKKELADDAKTLEVLVEFSVGPVVEKHWFPIERFELDENQDISALIVRRNAKVVLYPDLQPDELQKVLDIENLEWR